MYASAQHWQSITTVTARQIQDMEEVFKDPDFDPIDVMRGEFDYHLISFPYLLEYDCPVLTDEVCSILSRRMYMARGALFGEDYHNKWLRLSFTQPSRVALKDKYKQAVLNMNAHMSQFVERYEEMSFLERCFTIWSLEREKLSEQVFDAMYFEPYFGK